MRKLAITEFISYVFACLLGVISHFVYQWSNNHFLIGLFFPINESTWEHLKLVFFPILIVSFIEYSVFLSNDLYKPISNNNAEMSFSDNHSFICVKLKSALIGMFFTVILFYTVNGMFGKTPDYVNIIIYFISMAIAYLYSYTHIKSSLLQNSSVPCMTPTFQCFKISLSPTTCLILIFMITLIFMIFTIYPLNIPLFFAP